MIMKWGKVHDEPGQIFNYRSTTDNTTYQNTAYYDRGVINIQYFYRIPHTIEIDTHEVIKNMKQEFQSLMKFNRHILIFESLSKWGGYRVWRLQLVFKSPKPNDQEMISWYDSIANFDLEKYCIFE